MLAMARRATPAASSRAEAAPIRATRERAISRYAIHRRTGRQVPAMPRMIAPATSLRLSSRCVAAGGMPTTSDMADEASDATADAGDGRRGAPIFLGRSCATITAGLAEPERF